MSEQWKVEEPEPEQSGGREPEPEFKPRLEPVRTPALSKSHTGRNTVIAIVVVVIFLAAAIIVVLVVVAAAAFLVLSNGFGSDDDGDLYAKGDGTFTFTAEEAEVNGYEYTGTMTIVLVDGEMTMFDPDIDRTESGGIYIGGGGIEIIPPSDFQDYFPWGMDPTPPEGIQDANPYLDGFTYTWYSHEYSRGSIEVQAYCFESPDGYTLDVGEDGNVYGVFYEYGNVTLQFIRDGWNYSI